MPILIQFLLPHTLTYRQCGGYNGIPLSAREFLGIKYMSLLRVAITARDAQLGDNVRLAYHEFVHCCVFLGANKKLHSRKTLPLILTSHSAILKFDGYNYLCDMNEKLNS